MDEVRGGKEGGIGPNPNNNSCGTRPRPGPASAPAPAEMEKKGRPAAQEQLNCPRCNSSNTKFCYYNNYSLTQPRYFCKTCRRYWTEGGSLRNIPVGGGSRKNKKQQLITSASATANNSNSSNPSKVPVPDLNPKMAAAGRGHDLNLAFPTAAMDMDKYHAIGMSPYVNDSASSSCSSSPLSAMELLRSAGMASSGFNIPNYLASSSLMPNSSNALNYPSPSGFPMQMQDIKPNPDGFTVDGLGNRSSYDHQVHDHNAQRLLFPFGDHIKHLSADKEQGNSTGYWTGMIGEGSSW